MLGLLAGSPASVFDPLTRKDDEFLEELSHRAFLYFWERASPRTGLVLDRARNREGEEDRQVASSAATGFGLTGLCIGAERGWMPREALRARVITTLRFYARASSHQHGWFYHFVDANTGERVWKCEVSSIDTALLLAGVLTAKEYFRDSEVSRLADEIYQRIDFRWMLNDHPHLLTMGWHPESGFLNARWDHYCELLILYLMGIGSQTTPLAPESWRAWRRPRITYAGYTYISGAPTLFTHQYSHAWVDFRGSREETGGRVDWFRNSIDATKAHRQFCIDIGKTDFPGCYDETLWGITASDSAKGYVAWGGPPLHSQIDGTVVPCAAGGSLMFEPKLCLQALTSMRHRFGGRVWGRYGFADAFHPVTGWTDPDVIGIDVGITLLAAENARGGNVWKWFMRNLEIRKSLSLVRIGPEIGRSR
jgi:hypothetical protein